MAYRYLPPPPRLYRPPQFLVASGDLPPVEAALLQANVQCSATIAPVALETFVLLGANVAAAAVVTPAQLDTGVYLGANVAAAANVTDSTLNTGIYLGATVAASAAATQAILDTTIALEAAPLAVATVNAPALDSAIWLGATGGASATVDNAALGVGVTLDAQPEATATVTTASLQSAIYLASGVACSAAITLADLQLETTMAASVACVVLAGNPNPDTRALWRFEEPEAPAFPYTYRLDDTGRSDLMQTGGSFSVSAIDGLAARAAGPTGCAAQTPTAHPDVGLYGASDWTIVGTWNYQGVADPLPPFTTIVEPHGGLLLYSAGDLGDQWWVSTQWDGFDGHFILSFSTGSGEGPSVSFTRPVPNAFYTFAAIYDAAAGTLTFKVRLTFTGWTTASMAFPPVPSAPSPGTFGVVGDAWTNWDSLAVVFRKLTDAELDTIATTGPGILRPLGVVLTTAIYANADVACAAIVSAAQLSTSIALGATPAATATVTPPSLLTETRLSASVAATAISSPTLATGIYLGATATCLATVAAADLLTVVQIAASVTATALLIDPVKGLWRFDEPSGTKRFDDRGRSTLNQTSFLSSPGRDGLAGREGATRRASTSTPHSDLSLGVSEWTIIATFAFPNLTTHNTGTLTSGFAAGGASSWQIAGRFLGGPAAAGIWTWSWFSTGASGGSAIPPLDMFGQPGVADLPVVGVWYTLAARYSGGTLQFWVRAASDSNWAKRTATIPAIPGGGPVAQFDIGDTLAASGAYDFDTVAILHRALTDAELEAIANDTLRLRVAYVLTTAIACAATAACTATAQPPLATAIYLGAAVSCAATIQAAFSVTLDAAATARATVTLADLHTDVRFGASASATARIFDPTVRALWKFSEPDEPTGPRLRLDETGRSPLAESGPLVGVPGLDGRAGQHGVSGGGATCSGNAHGDVSLFGATDFTIVATLQFIDIDPGVPEDIRDHNTTLLRSRNSSGYFNWLLQSAQAGAGSWTLTFTSEVTGTTVTLVQVATSLRPSVWYTIAARYTAASGQLDLSCRGLFASSRIQPFTKAPGEASPSLFFIGPSNLEVLWDTVEVAFRAIPDNELDQYTAGAPYRYQNAHLTTAIRCNAAVACTATATALGLGVLAMVEASVTATVEATGSLDTAVFVAAAAEATAISGAHEPAAVALWRFEETAGSVRFDEVGDSDLDQLGSLASIDGIDGLAGREDEASNQYAVTYAGSPKLTLHGATEWTVFGTWSFSGRMFFPPPNPPDPPGLPYPILPEHNGVLAASNDADMGVAGWYALSEYAFGNWKVSFHVGNAMLGVDYYHEVYPSGPFLWPRWYTFAARYSAGSLTFKVFDDTGAVLALAVTGAAPIEFGAPGPSVCALTSPSALDAGINSVSWDSAGIVFRALSDAELLEIATVGPGAFLPRGVDLHTEIWMNAGVTGVATITKAKLRRETIPSYIFGTDGFQRIFKTQAPGRGFSTQGPGRAYSRIRGD